MNTSLPILLSLSLLLAAIAPAALIEQELLNSDGEPMNDITIRATRSVPSPLMVETITDAEGKFSLDLEDGNWFIEADPADILNRGYFCAPGIGIGITGGEVSIPSRPWITFVTFPLSPNVSVLLRNERVVLELDFEWLPNLTPILMRSYRVERSTDMQNWLPLATVLLSNPPLHIVDPTWRGEDEAVYYRAVEAGSIQMLSLDELW